MDYIRWLLTKHLKNDPQLILPCFVFAVIFTAGGFMLHPFVGAFVLTLSLAVFGTVAYAFISDAYRKSYKKYLEEKSKP